MKKIILSSLLLSSILLASDVGPIESKVININNSDKQLERIEKKLDILIDKIIEEERIDIARGKTVDSIVESTKSGLNKAKDWFSTNILEEK